MAGGKLSAFSGNAVTLLRAYQSRCRDVVLPALIVEDGLYLMQLVKSTALRPAASGHLACTASSFW